MIANVNVDFKKELLLTAKNPKVHVRSSRIGGKSFVLEYAITSQKSNETLVHAAGSTTQIMFDTKARSTIEVPDWVRKSLENFYHQISYEALSCQFLVGAVMGWFSFKCPITSKLIVAKCHQYYSLK